MKNIIKTGFFLLTICCSLNAKVNDIVKQTFEEGDFKLVFDNISAGIFYDQNDYKVVEITANHLATDITKVTGVRPAVYTDTGQIKNNVVIAGTIGKNKLIDQLISEGKIDTAGIAGQWETYALLVIEKPFANIDSALVIFGSDRRGTAYGIFELSKQIGVSAWYWWADVPIPKKNNLVIKKGFYSDGPPSVKYRGIFINDEDWGLHTWSKNTYAPADEGIGPKTYKKVFELLLRLKANHIWPGMHSCTKAFNAYEENKKVADDYAIVMGSSHCEQMLRNNVYEWERWDPCDGSARGKWDWCTNSEQITAYWEERIKTNASYENIYTMCMRGIHDSGMPCSGSSNRQKAEKMQDEVIPAQRRMLAKWVNPDLSKVPQIFCPYKEVLELYEMAMNVPEDITLVWPDDNHGYIRRLSNSKERSRSGGSGVYYHLSYWGSPHDFLWLCSTPPALIWEEMKKAYDYGANRVWVLNVGDIKPAEIGTEFFLQMAWDINRWNENNLDEFLVEWAESVFGAEFKDDIAQILYEYYRLAQARKPEHMGWSTVYPTTATKEPEFSPIHFGDESGQRIEQYQQIEKRGKTIFEKLPKSSKDAFYQLVYYPVRGASLMNQKYLYAQKSRLYASQGRVSANDYAAKAQMAHNAIIEETRVYNHDIADGKWKDIMSWNPRGLAVYERPKVAAVEPVSGASMGVVVEGQTAEVEQAADSNSCCHQLPRYDIFTKRRHFIDIFNKGDTAFKWKAAVSKPWIRLSSDRGTVKQQQRIWVEIDWAAVPIGENTATINIAGANRSVKVTINAVRPPSPRPEEVKGFVESNGYVSIEAEHFTRRKDAGGASWQVIPTLGRSGDSMTVLPMTTPSREICDSFSQSPVLEYAVYLFEAGVQNVKVYALATHANTSEHGLRYAVSFDDQPPQVVDYDTKEWSKPWTINVLRGCAVSDSSHSLSQPGQHILKIHMVDAGVVIDKIVIGDPPPSYLGPPETRVK